MSSIMNTYNEVGQNQLNSERGEFYQRAMLKTLREKVVLMPYGKKTTIPRNAGATTSWRTLRMPGLVTTAITEGETPDSLELTVANVKATVSQYGAWTKVSDYLDMAGLDPILTEVAEMFGEHAALSMDQIIARVLIGGTNVYYAGGHSKLADLTATDTLSSQDIIKARHIMIANNVPKLKLPNGNEGYVAFVHPDNMQRLMAESGGAWATFNGGGALAGLQAFQQGELGQMYGIYFIESSIMGEVQNGGNGGNLTAKNTLIIGADAFGIPDIAGSSKPEILVYGEGNTENPMALYKTVAWKTCFAAARLDEKRILRVVSVG